MDVVNADIAGANICPCSRNPTYVLVVVKINDLKDEYDYA
jgi:hypothetical protein